MVGYGDETVRMLTGNHSGSGSGRMERLNVVVDLGFEEAMSSAPLSQWILAYPHTCSEAALGTHLLRTVPQLSHTSKCHRVGDAILGRTCVG